MNDDSYDDDATQLAIKQPDDATMPAQPVPSAVRKRFDAQVDDATVERPALKRPPRPTMDPDATVEQAALKRPPPPGGPKPRAEYEEDATVLKPSQAPPRTQAAARLQPKPSRNAHADPRLQQAPSGHPGPERPSAPALQPRQDTAEQLKRLGLTRRKQANANHVRPNSGFYSLPDANATGSIDATVVGQINFADDNREAIGLLIGLGLGLTAALGLTAFALARWSPPGELLGIGLILMIICGVVTGGFLVPRENLRLADIKGALVPVGICLALILISTLSWQIGEIRDALRPFASEKATTSRLVLEDRSQSVAVSECQRLAEKIDGRAYREVLVDALVGRRAVATACIEGLDKERAAQVTRLLAAVWHDELMGEGVQGERACALADSLIALERPTGDIETRLLACVLEAPTTNVQSCCGVSLVKRVATSKESWLANLRTSDELDASNESTAAGLMTLAFHQQGVTGSQQEFVTAARFDGAAGRRLALSFACDALQEGAERLSQHFAASLGDDCAIDQARVPQSREVWADVCSDALQRVANAEEPSKALCRSTRLALVDHAVADASRIVGQAAKDRSKKREMAIAIDVEANTSRGSLSDSFKALDAWGEKRRREHEAATSGPTFRPTW